MDVLSELNNLGVIVHETTDTNYIIKCPNPTHEDLHPSCRVDKTRGIYHCFSCGESGNMFTLRRRLGKANYKLNDKYLFSKPKSIVFKTDKSDIEITPTGGQFFSVTDNPIVLKKCYDLHMTDEFITKYMVSYSDYSEWECNYSEKKSYFYNRLLIPIYKGKSIINIEARTLSDDKPKVLYVRGGIADHVFNSKSVDWTKPVIIVEGLKDFWHVYRVDKNVVSIFGNRLTENKINILKQASEIILFMDNDKGGRSLASELDAELSIDLKICIPNTEGEDPADLSGEVILEKLAKPEYYVSWLSKDIFGSRLKLAY